MPGQHKHPPLRFRPPEPERQWLAAEHERTGKPVNAILTEGVRTLMTADAESALMAAHDDLAALAERLEAKARTSGDKTHLGTAAGVRLAAFRLIELAGRADQRGEQK